MTDTTPSRDAHEAHVQVLTAEVRTLVIGSRQVTMSVYNQLDDVPPTDIEPFGRLSPKGAYRQLVYVIGRCTATGALVRSEIPREPESMSSGGYSGGKAYICISSGTQLRYQHWPAVADLPQGQLAEVAKQWSALPLIVLAGLR